jgi:hypothetical protein
MHALNGACRVQAYTAYFVVAFQLNSIPYITAQETLGAPAGDYYQLGLH